MTRLPTGNTVDTATYFTGVIMLLLSLFAVSVLLYQLGGETQLTGVTFLLVLVTSAASYTVAQL